MRKKLLILVAAMISALPLQSEAATADFITGGRSDFVILFADTPAPLAFPPGESLHYAASFLADYLQRVTGCKLPLLAESEFDGQHNFISLGQTRQLAQLPERHRSFTPEGFHLQSSGSAIYLYGEVDANGRDRGTLFAVYEFLEQVAGVRWYFADDKWYPPGTGMLIPKRPTLELPQLDFTDAPALRQRVGGISYYSWPLERQQLWHPVLRFGDTRRHGTANHTQIGWTDLYGKSNPEYFALSPDGRRQINFNNRTRSYICLSHPGVLAQMLANIEEFDRTGKSSGAFGPHDPEPGCVHFSPNDGMTPKTVCHCDDCRPWLRPDGPFEGHSSELIFQFVKRYADAITSRWPGRRLAVLAYAHYKNPPREVEIPDNVDVTYVGPPVQYAMAPELYQQHHEAIKEWALLLGNEPERLNIWMNVHSPNSYTSFIPTLYPATLQKWLLEHREVVSGYFINGGNPHLRRRAPRFIWTGIQSYPMVWLQSRLLWNPNLDIAGLMQRYTTDLFGSAAPEMYQLLELIRKRWEGLYQSDTSIDETAFIHRVRYPAPMVEKLSSLLEEAIAKAADEPQVLQHLTFLKEQVYAHFVEESALFHNWGDRVATYLAPSLHPSEMAGDFPAESLWQNHPALHLVSRQWGEPTERSSEIALLHDQHYLYLRAQLHKQADVELETEELWIQSAREMSQVDNRYATNLPGPWPEFLELRIKADGTLSTRDKLEMEPQVEVVSAVDHLQISARIALHDLGVTPEMLKNTPQLRMQFLRTWGDWRTFDLWSPTLAHISDFPTYRFGIVHLTESSRQAAKSSLE